MKITVRSSDELGHAIKRFRKKKKLTQSQVAKPFNLRQAAISNLELGEQSKKLDTLFRVLASLNLEITIQSRKGSPENPIDEENW